MLKAKGIEYDCVNINLKDRPDWFYELNPLGKVPVIEMPDGKVLYESAICCGELKWWPSGPGCSKAGPGCLKAG